MRNERKTVYLAGGITGLTWQEANTWRREIEEELPDLRFLNPLRGKEYLLSQQKEIKPVYECVELTQEFITRRDRNDVKESDIILCNFLGSLAISAGTCMELGWANAWDKTIIVISEPGNVHDHPMINEIAHFRVGTVGEGIDLLWKLTQEEPVRLTRSDIPQEPTFLRSLNL